MTHFTWHTPFDLDLLVVEQIGGPPSERAIFGVVCVCWDRVRGEERRGSAALLHHRALGISREERMDDCEAAERSPHSLTQLTCPC
jgi:hypothetical protein